LPFGIFSFVNILYLVGLQDYLQLYNMQRSHGELLRKEVVKSGKSVTQVATELGISRAWLYHLFEKDYFSTKDVITISKQFPFSLSIHFIGEDLLNSHESNSPDYWKMKYEQLLKDFEDLQNRHQALIRMRR
jgi:DNA-binding phage protein